MKSEVETNSTLIRKGDILYYIDDSNSDTFIVLSSDERGFKAIDEDENISYHGFSELQLGWYISDRTKNMHVSFDRFEYK